MAQRFRYFIRVVISSLLKNVDLFKIDWNYHSFDRLIIRDNFADGLDIVYNDWTKKPIIRNSQFLRNRRNGIVVRSMGLTIDRVCFLRCFQIICKMCRGYLLRIHFKIRNSILKSETARNRNHHLNTYYVYIFLHI